MWNTQLRFHEKKIILSNTWIQNYLHRLRTSCIFTTWFEFDQHYYAFHTLSATGVNLIKIKTILENAKNWTCGCWVRSENATSELYLPPFINHFARGFKQLIWSLASSPRACIASCWWATALVTALRCLQDHHTWLFHLPIVRKEDFLSKLCFGVFQSWSSLNYLAFKWVFRSLLKSSLKFKWVNSGGGLFCIVLNFCLQFKPSSCQIQLHFRDIKCFMGDFNKSRKCWLH